VSCGLSFSLLDCWNCTEYLLSFVIIGSSVAVTFGILGFRLVHCSFSGICLSDAQAPVGYIVAVGCVAALLLSVVAVDYLLLILSLFLFLLCKYPGTRLILSM